MNKPTQPEATEASDISVRVKAIYLHDARFERKAAEPGEGQAEIQYGLGGRLLRPNVVGVEFSVEWVDWEFAELRVAYRCILVVEEPENGDEVTDEQLRKAVARLGPVIMYPYLREAASNLLMRTGQDFAPLPVMNMATMFDPDQVVLEPAEQDEDEEVRGEFFENSL